MSRVLSVVLLAGLCACAKSSETTTASTTTATATSPATIDVAAAVAKANKRDDPCSFVTVAEMQAILHAPVVTHVNGGNKCVYEPPSGAVHAQVQVERGDGRIAMKSAGAMSGMTTPLKGVGDQAIAVGPTIMVRSGEDLVQIEMSGVQAPIEKAKSIFNTVKKRL
jgi:hypothetical protein